MSADSVTLACGCTVTADADGVHLQPDCAAHQADAQALALDASEDPVVQALISAAGGPAPGAGNPSFSYSGDPAASPIDAVRFTLGDTDPAKARFTDAEINAVYLANNKSALQTALALCDILVSRFTGWVDESVGSVSIAYSQLADSYRRLGDTLRLQMGRRAAPWAGGINRYDTRALARDPSRVQPRFRVGMFDTVWGAYDVRPLGSGYRLDWSRPLLPGDP